MNTYLFAELDGNGWSAIIAAASVAILQILSFWRTGAKANAGLKLAEATHTLVNSNMGAQLTLHAIASQRIADLPNATETDRLAAVTAKKLLAEHEQKQAVVDAKK